MILPWRVYLDFALEQKARGKVGTRSSVSYQVFHSSKYESPNVKEALVASFALVYVL